MSRLAIRNLKKFKKTKIIYTAHGFHFYKNAPLKNWLIYHPIETYLAKFTDTIITINTEDYKQAKQYFSKYTNIEYMLGVGVDLERFLPISQEQQEKIRSQLGFQKDDFIITVVAELNRNKNQVALINAVPILQKQIPKLKVVFLGIESQKEARNLVHDLHLDTVCSFWGYRKDVDLFQKITNICFSASIREGLPVNIIEGMACGKPCVCSRNRGHNDLISHMNNGLLFTLNNKEEMIQSILWIYNNPQLSDKLALQAFQDSKKYDVKVAVDFISKLYNSNEKNDNE